MWGLVGCREVGCKKGGITTSPGCSQVCSSVGRIDCVCGGGQVGSLGTRVEGECVDSS